MVSSLLRSVLFCSRKLSEKVVDEVQDKLLAPIGLATARSKKLTQYDADAVSGSKEARPTSNKSICWVGPEKVEIQDKGYPKMQTPQGVPFNHGVILKVIATNICGTDLHLYRGTVPGLKPGMVFGHEITGEIFEMGMDVERFELGDIVSVPFNIACGKCDNVSTKASLARGKRL